MDEGGKVTAKVLNILGEYPESSCVIEVGKYVADPTKLSQFYEEDVAVRSLIAGARSLEKTSPEESINNYLLAMRRIEAMDRHPIGRNFRTVRCPINRLTLALEQNGRLQECLEIAKAWQESSDHIGISKGDRASLDNRLDRVQKKLSASQNNRDRKPGSIVMRTPEGVFRFS
jgi:hypothetical protein